ncbi:hypothetical protein [Spongiimicrobium salis]|uniref:hypothetical protein n=1 Tax=Spongiimicrobium salis TaxID=1667022 RepID=UPI00374D3326
MKKQTKTYVLLGVVLVIWGMIGFRVYSSLSPESVENEVGSVTTFRPQKIKERERFAIVADYRDPFLGTLPVKKVRKKKKQKAVQPQEPMPEIKYTGYITDTETQGKIYFISMAGQQYMLSPREKVGEMTLIRGTEKSVKVRFKNKTHTIPLQQ